jgi:hypothetical protein
VQLFSVGGQGRGVDGVTAEPSWVAKRRRRCDPGEVWASSGWSPVARMSGHRPRRSSPCPRPLSAVRPSVQSVKRTSGVRCPRVRCPRGRCHRWPDGRACGVRGAAAALSAPRWPLEWLGAAGRPRGAQWVRRAAVVRGRPPASELDGKGWCCVGRGWLARGSPDLGRRIARAQAAAPPRRLADKGAGPAPGCRSVGGGAPERAGAHQSPGRWVLGRLPAWPDHGAGQGAVTTLGGRWAGDGPVSSVPEGPSGSAGEQAAAAARPRT